MSTELFMKFAEIRKKIVNNPGFGTLDEIKKAGYCIVRERDGERYFLAKPEELKPLLVRLGDIAEVRRGFTTGANDFFYLEPVDMTVKEVVELARKNPKAPIKVRNGAGWEGEIEAAWLRPVIKSPREIKTIKVRLEDLRYLVFMAPDDVRENIKRYGKSNLVKDFIERNYKLAAQYIEWGESAVYVCTERGCKYRGSESFCPRHGGKKIKLDAFRDRPSCRSRIWWWDLGEQEPSSFIWPMIHNDRPILAAFTQKIIVDHNLFQIKNQDGTRLTALMAATYAVIVRELFGRRNLGEGALKTEGTDIVQLLVISPFSLSFIQHRRLLAQFELLVTRSIRSIFEELGFQLCHQRGCLHPEHPYEYVNPKELTLDQVKKASPDRFELDRIVFDILGLTIKERIEVYRAVVQLVKERLVKARSTRR